MNHLTIAIDGPAGAGKSTIATILAKRLGIMHLDTGAMYRAVALKVMRSLIDPADHKQVISLLSSTHIQVLFQNNKQMIFLDGEDVTSKIRTPEISKIASDISAIPQVRNVLVKIQRQLASQYSLVIDGRDIGTYVLPHASKKFFLTASVEERAKRRWIEMKNKGYNETLESIKRDIIIRDKNDSNRSFAPLRKAEDAILIDSTNKSINEVMDEIISNICHAPDKNLVLNGK
jgi:cytidylate kinase